MAGAPRIPERVAFRILAALDVALLEGERLVHVHLDPSDLPPKWPYREIDRKKGLFVRWDDTLNVGGNFSASDWHTPPLSDQAGPAPPRWVPAINLKPTREIPRLLTTIRHELGHYLQWLADAVPARTSGQGTKAGILSDAWEVEKHKKMPLTAPQQFQIAHPDRSIEFKPNLITDASVVIRSLRADLARGVPPTEERISRVVQHIGYARFQATPDTGTGKDYRRRQHRYVLDLLDEVSRQMKEIGFYYRSAPRHRRALPNPSPRTTFLQTADWDEMLSELRAAASIILEMREKVALAGQMVPALRTQMRQARQAARDAADRARVAMDLTGRYQAQYAALERQHNACKDATHQMSQLREKLKQVERGYAHELESKLILEREVERLRRELDLAKAAAVLTPVVPTREEKRRREQELREQSRQQKRRR